MSAVKPNDMKQRLLKMLSEKNTPMVQKQSKSDLAPPIEMSQYQRQEWLFSVLNKERNVKDRQKELENIHIKLQKMVIHCKTKEMKWARRRKALKDEIAFLKQLLVQDL